MERQVCRSCKTEYTGKPEIDVCPVCRGRKVARWDYVTFWDYVAGRDKTELVKLA